ncbi:hypothetical protein CDAR_278851 [Caerostris darwini]|uniref:Uncharacterized protein n=1 Tax=Caerostris darwini TaxID=1538125 RepID=A0AAV4WNI6_9ARAC|nr:hypothetical protein CDAR_278851 [Caerostris darwini]
MGHKNRHFNSLCSKATRIAQVAGLDPPARNTMPSQRESSPAVRPRCDIYCTHKKKKRTSSGESVAISISNRPRPHSMLVKRMFPAEKSLWRHLDGLIAQGGRRQGAPPKRIFEKRIKEMGPILVLMECSILLKAWCVPINTHKIYVGI